MSMTKERLTAAVTEAQRGSGEAISEIYAATFDHVFYTAKKILRDEQAAQDVAQDVFVTVLKRIGELKQPGAFLGWVRQITAFTCNNYLRKKGNQEILYSPSADADEDSGLPDVEDDVDAQPDEILDRVSTRQIILDIVDSLPDAQREAVMLFYFEQMPVKVIAQTLHENEATIKSRLNYARKAIKAGVEREESESGYKLHSISALFLLRLFQQDAAANLPAPGVSQSILDSVLVQAGPTPAGVSQAGQGAAQLTGAGEAASTGASITATAGKAGLSLGVKIGIAAAGLAVVGGIIGFVAVSINNNSEPVNSTPTSQPMASVPASVAAVDASAAASMSEPEEPAAIGLPTFGENDLAFLSKYLYTGENGDNAASDLAAFLGTEPLVNTGESRDSKRDERFFYWMDDTTYSHNDGMDLEGISYWMKWFPDFGAVEGRECDSFQLSITMDGYSALGFEYGMSLSDAQAQAQVIMALDGVEVVEFTDFATMEGYLSDGFWLRFFYDGCEYLISVNCPRGQLVVDGIALSGKGADKDITDLGWIG